MALAFHLQNGLGLSPLLAGLILTCWPLAVAATNLLASKAEGRVGVAVQCTVGGILLCFGLVLCAVMPDQATIALLVIGPLVCGMGFGLFQLANNRNMFLSAPIDRSAAAGGMQGTARLSGQILGTLLVSLSFTWTSSEAAPKYALFIGAAFALVSAIVSLKGKRAPAATRAPA